MKKKNIHISIDTPCNEKFENFKATELGGYCMSCEKEVIDFSKMTNQQIIDKLKNTTNSCGRFQEIQLGNLGAVYDKQSNFSFPYITAGLSLISMLGFSNLFGQETPKRASIRQTYNVKSDNTNWKSTKIALINKLDSNKLTRIVKKNQTIKIRGKVVDENKEPLIAANVIIKGTNSGVIADINGVFEIDVADIKNDSLTLQITYIGFVPKDISIPLNSTSSIVDLDEIIMQSGAVMMGAMVMTMGGYSVQEKKWTPKWVWRKTTTPFRKLYYKIF